MYVYKADCINKKTEALNRLVLYITVQPITLQYIIWLLLDKHSL